MMIEKADRFRKKMESDQLCLGTVISLGDPLVTVALCPDLDFVWMDMEHSTLTLEQTSVHIGATAGFDTAPLVRVPWNDSVWIKRVLDTGPSGIVVPQVQTVDDVRHAVEACLYPPEGIRGFGPRRTCGFGRVGGADFCRQMNESVIVMVQIENIEAVHNLDEILQVPGLTGILLGPNDLAGSMGHVGKPRHPEVLKAAQVVIDKGLAAGVHPGVGIGCNIEHLKDWIDRGVRWLSMGADFFHLAQSSAIMAKQLRKHDKIKK